MSIAGAGSLEAGGTTTLGAIRRRAGAAIGAHFVVDYFSYVIVALMPLLVSRLALSPGRVALLLAAGSIASGVVQPLAALVGDRLDTRRVGTIGMVLAVVAVGLIGQAQTFGQLMALHVASSLGIGAFHPQAAAVVGQLSGRRRSWGVAIFFVAGMLGGIAGNTTTPAYVARVSVEGLAWLIAPGLAFAVVLAAAIHRVPHRQHGAREHHASLPPDARRARWRAVSLLYVGNALRFVVNMALVHLLIAWSTACALASAGTTTLDEAVGLRASALNGPLQGALQLGMGAAGLVAGFMLARRHERAALIVVPMLGAAGVALFPAAAPPDGAIASVLPAAIVLSIVAGVGFGGLVPVTISMAQRLLPHRTGLASGLMMGGAWSVAAVGPPLAQLMLSTTGLVGAFAGTAALLVLSGLVAAALPREDLLRTAEEPGGPARRT